MSALTTETLVQKAIELMDSKTPAEIAIAAGVSTDGKAVREVIRGAREKFLRHIDAYVDQHAAVVRACMENGDSKSLAVAAAATQWAIENANDGKTRVLEPAKASVGVGPRLSIGIAVGGVPARASIDEVPPHAMGGCAHIPVIDA